METKPIPLNEGFPGCKRDSTWLEGNFLIDNQWNRAQYGRNKSMGGYRRIINALPQISRGINSFYLNNETHMSVGMASYLYDFDINQNGVQTGVQDRTPAAFVADANNLWQFDYLYDSTSATVRLIAHAAPNLTDISSSTSAAVWYGDAGAAAVLTSTGSSVSGGIACLQPYLFTFGTAGVINWSVANKPDDFSNPGSGTARIGAMKIVAGRQMRGGAGNSPSGLFWSLDSVIRASFVGGTAIFQFDTFGNQASILSSQSIVEYDGIYYWAGIDRFMMFNGVLREVPNDMNLNWFFDGLNYAQRQKVFAFKIPRYGEIWWCYPRDGATECTHAVILNLREKRPDGQPVWYDTELPGNGRTCAKEAQVFNYPVMGAVDPDPTTGEYRLWQHEYGDDELDGVSVRAIQKFYETPETSLISPYTEGQGIDLSMVVDCMEPDMYQTEDITIQMIGRANARAPEQAGTPQTLTPSTDGTGVTAENQLIFFPRNECNQRLARFRIESNVQGGSYFSGKCILHVAPADGRRRT